MGWTFHEGELDRDDVRALARPAFRRNECRDAAVGMPRPARRCARRPGDSLLYRSRRGWRRCSAAARSSGLATIMARSSRCAPPTRRLGRGVGSAMLDHLTAAARAAGMTRLSLETGNSDLRRRQPALPARGVRAVRPVRRLPPDRLHHFLHRDDLAALDSRREAAASRVVCVDMVDLAIGEQAADRGVGLAWLGQAPRHVIMPARSKARSDRMRRSSAGGTSP